MKIEIVNEPLRFQLYGIGGVAEKGRVGEVGFRLMNEMWRIIRSASIQNTGLNHWVYLSDGRMFVGVQLQNPPLVPESLKSLEFELQRYAKHLHVGPYQSLPQKWSDLKAELAVRGEAIGAPSLEIYGHHCDDPAQSETTILIGLQAKSI